MIIDSKRDVKLLGRAMREGWDVDREKVNAALMDVIDRRDPDLMLDAIALLLRADQINVKREELAQKTGENERARLLDIAKHIPARELIALASESGVVIDATVDEQVQ